VVHGSDLALAPSEFLPMVTTTLWGIGWMLGLAGALALWIGWTVSPRSVVIGTPFALAGGLAMATSPALSGHAASSRHMALAIGFDVLHVAAASVWLGGLFMVLIAGMPAMRRLANDRDAVASLVNCFHPVALFCAPIVVVAGLGTSWLRIGAWSAAWGTTYGRTLLLKLAIVLLVAGMGAYNSMRARRRLNAGGTVGSFRVTASIELLFAAVVLAVTTVLVTTPVPTEMLTPP
jgi:copper transport protein